MAEKTHRLDYEKYLRSLCEFMDENGLEVTPFPKFRISNEKQNGVFIKTGYYNPNDKTVTLFVRDRHIKDVLRSAAHELIHHNQNLEGRLVGYEGDRVVDDDVLKELEREEYEKGNILFRSWTETQTKSEKPSKSFSKHMKKKININETEIKDVQDFMTRLNNIK